MKARESRTYYGVRIDPIRTTIMGCRWVADSPPRSSAPDLRADTLDGIKKLIRQYWKKGRI